MASVGGNLVAKNTQALSLSSDSQRNLARAQSASSNPSRVRFAPREQELQNLQQFFDSDGPHQAKKTTKLARLTHLPEEDELRGDVASTKFSKTWGPSSGSRWVASGHRHSDNDRHALVSSASAPGSLHPIGQMPPSSASGSKKKRPAAPTQIMLFPSLLEAKDQTQEEARSHTQLEAKDAALIGLPRIQTPLNGSMTNSFSEISLQPQHRVGTPALPDVVPGQINDAIHGDKLQDETQSFNTSQESFRCAFSPSRSLKAGEALNGATIDEWITRRAAISTRETTRSIDSRQQQHSSPRPLPVSCKASSAEDYEKWATEMREIIRGELIRAVGGAHEAFRAMDLSGSGQISFTEFSDGLRRLGVEWRDLTGLWRIRDLFKIFDKEPPHGILSLTEMFPKITCVETESQRLSTPEFWNRWCRGTDGAASGRAPQWSNASKEEGLQTLFDAAKTRQDISDRRRWISSTMRRLKTQGKSSARCREVCVHHLPRGTGPKDVDDVHTFSEAEVKQCKRSYHDKVNTPVRNIQKTIYDMREQRKVLQTSKMSMMSVTHRISPETKHALGGILNFGASRHSVSHDPEEHHPSAEVTAALRRASRVSWADSVT